MKDVILGLGLLLLVFAGFATGIYIVTKAASEAITAIEQTKPMEIP